MIQTDSKISDGDKAIIRDLARQVMALAESEEYERRRQRWRDVNELRKPDRAPVWCRPAGAWAEIIPRDSLESTHPLCRQMEYRFRRHLYKNQVGDDHIIEPWWGVSAVWQCNQEHTWGLETRRSIGSTADGGFRYYHPVQQPEDYEKVTIPQYNHDRDTTQRLASQAAEVLGAIMPVRITGSPPLGPHLSVYLERLRGMAPMMEDIAFRPELVHRVMAKLSEAVLGAQRVAEQAGVLSTNHHEPMFCSDPVNNHPENGSVGLHNLWIAVNSQEFDQISPDMQEEFLLSYQRPLMQQYGRSQYGCCEDLSEKIDYVLRIPNLRIFVCSYWTDLDRVIEKCGGAYTIMWRQSSAQVTLPDDLSEHREHLESGLKRLQGCHYQVVLRELETLRGRENRLREWAKLGIEMAEKYS